MREKHGDKCLTLITDARDCQLWATALRELTPLSAWLSQSSSDVPAREGGKVLVNVLLWESEQVSEGGK